jgi:hypothetical protein
VASQCSSSPPIAWPELFVDIRAAFYSVVKQMFHANDFQQDQLRQVFHKMGLPETVWECFVVF